MPSSIRILTFMVLGAWIALTPAAHGAGGDARVTVALDPGHGGEDPGAEADGLNEADLVLEFAERLATLLEGTGRFDVVLTREGDHSVPLDRRLTVAREGGADVFVSLHADALAPGSGHASGLTVYTLDDDDVAHANERLLERHDEADMLNGMDLSGAGEDVSLALIALSRQENFPRSQMLAQSLLTTFTAGNVTVNNRPHRHGGFAVLKAADMPSVLIELGFLSSAKDRKRLLSEDWLQEAALAIRDGLLLWQSEDRLFREQVRR